MINEYFEYRSCLCSPESISAIGKNMGRPRKPFDVREAEVIGEAYQLYRFGARMLEVAVRKVFKTRISHNRIHMYLKAADLAHEDAKKKKRRKWVRYERKHSLSTGHIDWHESGWSDLKVCVIIDDASKMILACPAKQAGLIDHIWDLHELLTYPYRKIQTY